MRHFVRIVVAIIVIGVILSGVYAQNNSKLEFGDPPVAALMTISAPDPDGLVVVSGAAGSVFPGAQVTVRNLYTNDTVYTQAGLNGVFTATIYGPGNTPFWISPANNIPTPMRDKPGSLPGGPGVILYGSLSQPPASTTAISQILLDGELSDWEAYPDAALTSSSQGDIYSIANQDSLYVALQSTAIPAEYTQLNVTFTLDEVVYTVTLDPRQGQQLATLSRLQPNPNSLPGLVVGANQADAIEIRIPYAPINVNNPTTESASVQQFDFLGADGSSLVAFPVQKPVRIVTENDGIVRLSSSLGDKFTRFTLSGTLAQGSQRWLARGRINQLAFQPGDTISMELDVTMNAPALPAGLVGMRIIGELGLQPVVGPAGAQTAGGIDSNNGWSDILTPSGMPLIDLHGEFKIAEAIIDANQIQRRGEQLMFPLDFTFQLPDDLPTGIYVPFFKGYGQVEDGDIFAWEASSPLGSGSGTTEELPSRLPVVLNIGTVASGRLLWTLFQDSPSNGGRGLLADEDRSSYGLANRVHFDNPTYILPPNHTGTPIPYPIEPYLLSQMPNAYDHTAAPLIPFLFPGGRLSATITRPDGQVDDLGTTAIVQNQISTAALDESALFGATSPVDIYRLTTLNSAFTDYIFSQYGEYKIALSGNLEDTWGNRYDGGGTYSLVVAEPIDILPGVMTGTPFEVGDAFYPGLHLTPGGTANVTITARLFPLDDSAPIEHVIEGTADQAGYFFAPDDGFTFDVPGEYVIDYEARYTDDDGRLWAGSLRSAGVVASPKGSIIAHGERGLDGDSAPFEPAWFNARTYEPNSTNRLLYPYHSGDVAWIADGPDGQMKPTLRVQDTAGTYSNWLLQTFPGFTTPEGTELERLIVKQELPLTTLASPDSAYGNTLQPDNILNYGYSYLSAVMPGLTARQFVQGGLDGQLPLYWDMDDPYNGQPGAGLTGVRPNDYFFLFGGAVLRNEEAGIQDTAIYAASAFVIDGKLDTLGERVYSPYRGEAGGPDGGPLLVLNDREINLFFHPTGIRPGDVLQVGDKLAVSGQLAPTLPSIVSVKATAPSGEVHQFEAVANSIGYFYEPSQDFVADEPGVWSIEIHARHEGITSAGQVEPPPPTGDVLGTDGGLFYVYVIPEGSQPLEWSDTRSDFNIPAAIPYNFRFPVPADWTDVQVYHSLTTPAFVLDQGPLRPSGQTVSYQYNTTNLIKKFPNLESTGQGEGPAASDVVTLTLAISGRDANGTLQIRTRTFTIAHDRLMTFG